MHILILPSFYPGQLNKSLGYFFKEQARILARDSNKVAVIYVEQITLKKLNLRNLSRQLFQKTVEKYDNYCEYKISGWNIPTSIGRRIWIWLSIQLIKKYIKKEGKPEIMHVHNTFYAGVLALKVKEKFKIPIVITEHDSRIHIKQVTKEMIELGKKVHKEASASIAVSNSLAQSMKELFSIEKPIVIPNVVDINFFKPDELKNLNNEKVSFISIGHLYENKGHALLIKAFAELHKENENISLNICGEGGEKYKLLNLIKELDLEDSIKLHGHLKREDIKKLLNESDCLVHSSFHETFGVVLIEAMSGGKPFITSKCGGTEDIYEKEFGYIYEPGNVSELKNAMSKFIQNKDKFDPLKIREMAILKYSDEVIYSKLYEVLENCMKSK